MTRKILLLIALTLIQTCLCNDIEKLFEIINKETIEFNALGADIAWQSLINPDNPTLPSRAAEFQKNSLNWQHKYCDELATLYYNNLLNATQKRQTYLLCRGPKYTYEESRKSSNLYEKMQTIYNNVQVCFPAHGNHSLADFEVAILNSTNKLLKFERSRVFKKVSQKRMCLKGEKDFERIMKFSKNEAVLRGTWLVWRENIKAMKAPYLLMVEIENRAAKRNGYTDIGAIWRDETEILNIRQLCYRLYQNVLPLYKLLHGVARYQLRKLYGDIVPERGPIPAHLLGDLWSQSWETLADIILPRKVNLDDRIKSLNWTVEHMIKRAEDFYTSVGLSAMTDEFWRESVFTRENASIRCHGTAADMFQKDDYRLLYCTDVTFEDFYVLNHEMGHIQYYMAYNNQPGLFRQANTALHEAIGDTIMLGTTTPQHLLRLGLIRDTDIYTTYSETEDIELLEFKINSKIELKTNEYNGSKENHNVTSANYLKRKFRYNERIGYNMQERSRNFQRNETNTEFRKYNEKELHHKENKNNFKVKLNERIKRVTKKHKYNQESNNVKSDISTDDILILKQALNKLPQIPFSLVLDEYRWKLFEGSLDGRYLNEEFWSLSRELQGISPVGRGGEEYFDVSAKYHVADNIPYTRYFLSSFLQYQLFERLCKSAVYGRQKVPEPLPSSITLHRCDIYGSKTAGKILKDIMSRGHSQHWQEILNEAADIDKISSSALENYYRPLYDMLERIVEKYNIPIGW